MRRPFTLIPLLALVALLLGLALPGGARAAGTPAGTVITNKASVDALDASGQPISAESDPVTTTVSAVCAVSVTPAGTVQAPGQSASLLPGEQAVFKYTLTNVGNQTSTFALTSPVLPPSAYTPNVALYPDPGNGVPATGQQPMTSVTLAADQSAKLLMVVQTASADRGAAYVDLGAACPQGQASLGHVSAVTVEQPPVLSLAKSFSPASVRPGEKSTVTLTASNSGAGASREVIVTDVLNTPGLAGSRFVPGSAAASSGTVEYSADGLTWSSSQPPSVAAIRLRVPSLAPGTRATLSFSLITDASAENRTLHNVATLTSPDTPGAQASADLPVHFNPAVALGPVGNPQAPEGSPADQQSRDFAVVGQQLCFTQSLLNSGDVADSFSVSSTVTDGQADVVLRALDGSALAQPISLAPGQRLDFQVCLTPRAAKPVKVVLTAKGARGTQNSTTDLITRVESQLPTLTKTVDPVGQVQVGTRLTYTLSVTNPYDLPLTGVVVTDPLDANLTFVSASDGGTLSGGAVVWNLGTLAPGETRTLSLVATVSASAKDGDTIQNTFGMTGDQFPSPLPSPIVKTPVWSAALAVVKTVSPQEASVGDRLSYSVRIRNLSQAGTLQSLTVTDTLPVGLAYIPGTAQLNGQPLADPQIAGRVLTWTLGALGPGQEALLTYATRVTAEAGSDLTNIVTVSGQGGNGATVASNEARAKLKLRPGLFAPLSEIVGFVFVDRDRDGVFKPGIDTPVERARVLLADGRFALTDASGRYHFADVPEGFTALRLDPQSLPYPALSVPQDGGRPGSRGVYARGLVAVDFPLAALSGEVAALRQTTLRDGPLTVNKQLALQEDGSYLVTLTLSASGPVAPFTLEDPLPAGARLTEGQNTLDIPSLDPSGQTLSYRFAFDGPSEAATTDPTVTWRKP